MNQLVRQEGGALALSEAELVRVLGVSLYPGAAPESIKLVIAYCKAAHLDPMQKPVHIVPMYDKNAQGMRDVIMPGINLYRTQASRTGEFAGMTKAEFGETVTWTFREKDGKPFQLDVPETCTVTVKRRLPTGEIAEFTSEEYWEENYATAARDTDTPNAMWRKRPRGQLAKCAQAQALRMAFPELASAPTADELEGKTLDASEAPPAGVIDAVPPELLAAGRAAADQGVVEFVTWWKALSYLEKHLIQFETDALKLRSQQADAAKPRAAEAEVVEQPAAAAAAAEPAPAAAPAESQPAAEAKPAETAQAAAVEEQSTDDFRRGLDAVDAQQAAGGDDAEPSGPRPTRSRK